MRRFGIALMGLIMSLGILAMPTSASAQDYGPGELTREIPASGTPQVLDGEVDSIAQVGDILIVGGSFSQVSDFDGVTVLTRSNLFAYNTVTKQILDTFNPAPNGQVNVVIPAGDGQSVYVGGSFTTVAGQTRKNLVRLTVANGSLVTAFNPGNVDGKVLDLRLTGGRLFVAGAFTHLANRAQTALATVNPTTGAYTSFMALPIAGTHRGGTTTVMKMDITPDGSRLVAIGNFLTLGGVTNDQVFMLDLTGTAAAPASWQTSFYATACSTSFNTYMRDIDISPDGSFFVISTTGAYKAAGSACDSTARFNVGDTGSGRQPAWVNNTGGDTTYAVEITPSVVYTGGHFRWQNNPFRGDAAAQGSVSREGLAALDPINGLPLTWNPTRERGVGVFDFLPTDQGLWVGHDTNYVAGYHRERLALMPTGGVTWPGVQTPTLPNDIYDLTSTTAVKRNYDGTTMGSTATVDTGSLSLGTLKGGFMLNGYFYAAWSDGTFTKQTYDGTTFGTRTPVNGQDLLVPLTDWQTDIKAMTGMFYDSGRIYFTKTGNTTLFYRYFTPQSDIVGAQRLTASGNVTGIDFNAVRGMFYAGGNLYWSTVTGTGGSATGDLRRIQMSANSQAMSPVAGTATVVSSPAVGGINWGGSTKTLFLYQAGDGGALPVTPTAVFGQSCTSLDCTFDASESSVSDGATLSYSWDFGDGASGEGVDPDHAYATSGTYTVTLTVTSSRGPAATTSHDVQVTRVNKLPKASFTSGCDSLNCSFDASGSSDPDGTVTSFDWDFGDGQTGTGTSPEHTYAAPGTYHVGLTVTDNEGGSDAISADVQVTSVGLGFVGAASTNGNRSNHSVVVPAGTQAGDTMLLFFSDNSDAATVTGPAGWDLVQSTSANTVSGRAWTRQATASSAGSTITIVTSAAVKSDVSIAVYRAADGSESSVQTSASASFPSTASFTTPGVSAQGANTWLVSYAGTKSANALTWTLPGSEQQRAASDGSGSGRVSARLFDSGHSLAPGAAGALPVTLSEAAKGTAISVVVSAAAHVNKLPTASFTTSCTLFDCTVDAGASTDPDGSITSYEWDWGDGATAAGPTPPVHTYATTGTYQVTLTVTDNEGGSDTITKSVRAAEPTLQFVAATSSNGNRSSHTVTVPAGTQAGDLMLLFLADNSSSSTITGPSGWDLVESVDSSGAVGRAWARTASAASAGSAVTVTTSAAVKSDVSIAVYRAADGNAVTVTDSGGLAPAASGTAFTTPGVAVTQPRSWVINYYGAKSSAAVTWGLPGGQLVRTTSSGSGSGAISASMSDSGSVVGPGSAGGDSATTSASARAVVFTLVVAAS